MSVCREGFREGLALGRSGVVVGNWGGRESSAGGILGRSEAVRGAPAECLNEGPKKNEKTS